MSFVFAPSPPDLAPWVIGFGERRDLRAFSAMRELPMPSPALQTTTRPTSTATSPTSPA